MPKGAGQLRDLSLEDQQLLARTRNQAARDRDARDAWDRERQELVRLIQLCRSRGLSWRHISDGTGLAETTVRTRLKPQLRRWRGASIKKTVVQDPSLE